MRGSMLTLELLVTAKVIENVGELFEMEWRVESSFEHS